MPTPLPPKPDLEEPVWTYRGYRLKTSEFVTAMVHLFRSEIQRANVWRQRLDTTTNWAVVTTGAAVSIAFSQPEIHHGIIILNTLLVTWFLFIEARRYRYYELWSYRVRLMETDFFAAMLVPPFHPSADWAESLAENLLSPSFPISMWEAFGRRLRRNYLWIFLILGLAWIAKTWLFPEPPADLAEFITRGAVGSVSGQIMIGLGLIYYGILAVLAIATLGMTRASGEVLPRFGSEHLDEQAETSKVIGLRGFLAPRHKRRQYLAIIITDQPEAVSSEIIKELRRGVTALSGKGMYTGEARAVLMCALTVTEINNLKAVTSRTDPKAFVVISSAQNIFGRGFAPLDEKAV